MRNRLGSAAYVALAFAFLSCSDSGPLSPVSRPAPLLDVTAAAASVLPPVRISEFHYDHVGNDSLEKIEISGPAGTDLTGWKVVLYNGAASSRAPYTSTSTPANLDHVIIPPTCGARGVVFLSYGKDGIQNGSPDGLALVDASGAVVELISYEGSFTAVTGATGGPAAGLFFPDIGVQEAATAAEGLGKSLKRDDAGVWTGPTPASFGQCNPLAVVDSVVITPAATSIARGTTSQFVATATAGTGVAASGVSYTWTSTNPAVATVDATGLATGVATGDAMIIAAAPNGVADTSSLHVGAAAPPPGLPETRFSEIHYDNTGTDTLEKIEVEGPAGKDVTGWTIVLYNGNGGVTYSTSTLTGPIPATCDTRGVLVVDYPKDGIQNGSPDGFALIDDAGNIVEFLSYEGTFQATDGPALGLTSKDIGVSEVNVAIGQSLHRKTDGSWEAAADQNFGYCYGQVPPPPPPPPPQPDYVTFTGRVPADPPLPVGFEDQLFAKEHLGSNGDTVHTTFTWTSETPNVATIDEFGVMHAVTAGSATFRATAVDGTTGSYTLPTIVATASTTAHYGNNTEFGDPTDWDESDDLIIRRAQYTTSFNKNRNTPNWVSYDLDASQMGSQDRCDCFTQDPLLPPSYAHISTADFTGAGEIAGYGIDRGHLARSADRTTGNLDNANTFLFSNIIPQAADLNQGPWALMENYLGDLARSQNKEVYIVAGVAGNIGTVKNEGKIVIPEKVWKVAVIMPRDEGLAQVHDYRDLEVIAVIAPNTPGVRNVEWTTWKTTVDSVEKLSGYDLLSLLPDKIENAVESNTKPPFAKLDGPYTSTEGSAVAMRGAASFDPNGTINSYVWDFDDGIRSSGSSQSHTYAQDGDYTVQLIVTDNDGLADTTTSAVHVANVAPTVLPFDGATLLPGEMYVASGSFTDPGTDPWSGTVNYGDGSGARSLSLANKTFSLSHIYGAAGTFTVTVGISDDDATSTGTQTVTVLTQAKGVQTAAALVLRLAKDGEISTGNANSLTAKLDAARQQLDRGNVPPVNGQLGAVLNELDAMVRSGRLSDADAAPIRDLVQRVLLSIAR
jgi:DNA/RNA endonuclease G (NUC1)